MTYWIYWSPLEATSLERTRVTATNAGEAWDNARQHIREDARIIDVEPAK